MDVHGRSTADDCPLHWFSVLCRGKFLFSNAMPGEQTFVHSYVLCMQKTGRKVSKHWWNNHRQPTGLSWTNQITQHLRIKIAFRKTLESVNYFLICDWFYHSDIYFVWMIERSTSLSLTAGYLRRPHSTVQCQFTNNKNIFTVRSKLLPIGDAFSNRGGFSFPSRGCQLSGHVVS